MRDSRSVSRECTYPWGRLLLQQRANSLTAKRNGHGIAPCPFEKELLSHFRLGFEVRFELWRRAFCISVSAVGFTRGAVAAGLGCDGGREVFPPVRCEVCKGEAVAVKAALDVNEPLLYEGVFFTLAFGESRRRPPLLYSVGFSGVVSVPVKWPGYRKRLSSSAKATRRRPRVSSVRQTVLCRLSHHTTEEPIAASASAVLPDDSDGSAGATAAEEGAQTVVGTSSAASASVSRCAFAPPLLRLPGETLSCAAHASRSEGAFFACCENPKQVEKQLE